MASTIRGSDNFSTQGTVLQIVNSETGTYATGTTQIPQDNTIPQSTEGTEFLTATITPRSANSKLLVELDTTYSSNTGSAYITGALFRDSGADAIAVSCGIIGVTGVDSMHIVSYENANAATATTFKFRMGPSVAATCAINGIVGSSGASFGGVMKTRIRITEISQ